VKCIFFTHSKPDDEIKGISHLVDGFMDVGLVHAGEKKVNKL
jgi:hypothetical protein